MYFGIFLAALSAGLLTGVIVYALMDYICLD